MSLIDLIIIVLFAVGFLNGFKRGVIKEGVILGGMLLVIVLAFFLKEPLSVLMYENLPFFNFDGIFKGATVLNILIYEGIAFFVVLSILVIILNIAIFVSGVIEKILRFTIILGIPSKILGGVVGLIESYVVIFIILYVLSFPNFNPEWLGESNLKSNILNSTPILTTISDNTIDSFTRIYELKDEYEESEDIDSLNYDALDILLDEGIISVSSVELLISKGKINIENIDVLINKYK